MPKNKSIPVVRDLFADEKEHVLPLSKFPKTRYQGSKRRLLTQLDAIFKSFKPTMAIDLYSGTATVSLLLRMQGWKVVSNDFLLFNNATARVLLSSYHKDLRLDQAREDLQYLLHEAPLHEKPLVANNFSSIYFKDDENLQIDRFAQNVRSFPVERRDIYIYAVGQSLLMKRPYNLFHRANLDMRTRNVERSFGNVTTWNAPILEHSMKIISSIINFPFPKENGTHFVTNHNTLDLTPLPDMADLIYLDPPYLNRLGQGVDYCHFYHFLDGLCDYQLYAGYDGRYPHRPIVMKPSAWLNNVTALDELGRVLKKWPRATIVLSYRSDGRPNFLDISDVFIHNGREIHTVDTHDYKHALSHKEDTKEIFLISKPS